MVPSVCSDALAWWGWDSVSQQPEHTDSPSEDWRLADDSYDGWPEIDDARDVLVDTMPDVFFVADRRGRYRDCNDRFSEVLGYTDEEVTDLDAMEIIAPADRALMGEKLRRVAAGQEETLEAHLLTKDGEQLPYELRAAPLTDDDGDVWGLVGTARDISERVSAQERLRERERRFSTLVSNHPGIVYRCRNEPGWPMTFVSEGCAELTGYDAEALESGEVSWGEEIVHPDDRERLWEYFQQAIDDREPYTVTYRITRKDGTERWLWEQGRCVETDDGETVALEGFITDISERKRREHDLERYEQLIETIGDAMYVVGEDMRLREANDALTSMFGIDREEALGTHLSEFVTEETAAKGTRRRLELNECDEGTVATMEGTAIRACGERFPIEVRFIPLDGEIAGLGLIRDITDRKERAALFEDLHEGMRELMDAETPTEVAAKAAGVIGTHFESASTFVRLLRNDTLEMVAMETDEEGLLERLPPYDIGEGFVGEAYERGEPVVYDDLATIETAVDYDPFRSAMLLPIDGYGMINIAATEPDAFDEIDLELGRLFVADVEAAFERAEREETLRDRKRDLEKYETLVETMSDGVYMTDGDSNITMVNDTFAELLGHDREALLGRSIDEVAYVDADEAARYRQELRENDATVGCVEDVIERADGRERYVENRFSLLSGETEFSGTVGVVRDVTDRKQREDLVRDLHDVSRQLMAAESKQAVAERTAAAAEQLGFATVGIRLLDETGERLEPVAQATNNDRLKDKRMTSYQVGEGAIGRVYERGEPVVADDLRDFDTNNDPLPARSALWLPIEGHGLITIAATEPDAFDETDLELGRLFVADVEAAFERAEHEEQLRSRKRDLEKYETLVETMSDGVYMTDSDNKITMVNDAMVELSGYGREELSGMEITTLWDDDVAERGRAERERLIEGDGSVGQFSGPFHTASGETVPVENRFAPLPTDRGFQGTVGVLRDVTRQKEREERLKSQRDELETLNRINELVQETIGALASAANREEIERTVRERMANSSLYRFVVTGRRRPDTGLLESEAAPELGAEYLDDVTISATSDDDMAGPAAQALETGEITVIDDVLTDPLFEPYREQAREHGVRSVAVVPFTYGGVSHGVLGVYADRPGAFSEREIQAFDVLGDMVGFAISATQNRRLIEADSHLELTFSLTGADVLAAEVTEATGCTCRLLGAAEASDDGILHYVSVTNADPEAVVAAARESEDSPAEIRVVRADESEAVLEIRHVDSVQSVLLNSGLRPLEVVAEDGAVRIVAEGPRDSDIRTITDRLGAYGDVSLVSKRDVQGWEESSGSIREELRDSLTDRQRAALNAAYFGGYFDWPRDSTAEEVAASLDISSATLHQHLRHAQRKLIAAYVADEPGSI